MAKPHIRYEKTTSLPDTSMIPLGQLRAELSHRIHHLENLRSTDAFMDIGLCYFDPRVILEAAVKLQPSLDSGDDMEFTNRRRRVIESVVCKLKEAGAIAEDLLLGTSFYCGKFRICLGRGCADPVYLDRWLIPVRPDFFWGGVFPDVPHPAGVVERRRLTGLAALRWVAPLGRRGVGK